MESKTEIKKLSDTKRFGSNPSRLPLWLRKSLSPGNQSQKTDNLLKSLNLNTICQSGKCPNRNECYSQKTATFMIMGDLCTRNCHYCSVKPGKPLPLDVEEPAKVTKAVGILGLKHAVITSVTRDDVEDEGVGHFSETIYSLRKNYPELIIEVLTPDFRRDPSRAAKVFAKLPIDIFNHNIETVRNHHSRVRPQGGYDLSLNLLKEIHELNPSIITKSGAMLGLGETQEEVLEMMKDLRDHKCQMLTLGQYLQPDKTACPVDRYIHPDEFGAYKKEAARLGFDLVESGPFVRSSYHAKDSFEKLIQLTNKNRNLNIN